jgi:hypothetical protein
MAILRTKGIPTKDVGAYPQYKIQQDKVDNKLQEWDAIQNSPGGWWKGKALPSTRDPQLRRQLASNQVEYDEKPVLDKAKDFAINAGLSILPEIAMGAKSLPIIGKMVQKVKDYRGVRGLMRAEEIYNPRIAGINKSINNVGHNWYINSSGERAYMPNEEHIAIVKKAKEQVMKYIADPRYKSVVEKNIVLSNRLGSPTTFRSGKQYTYPELSIHDNRVKMSQTPFRLKDPRELEQEILNGSRVQGANEHSFTFDSTVKPESIIDIPRLFNPKTTARIARHEIIHNIHPDFEILTNVERSKLDRAFKPFDELAELEKTYKTDYQYIRDPSERITNSFDLADEIGIGPFNKYPGISKFKPVIDTYKGDKEFIKDAYKLSTPRDYKRVWDLLTGTLIGSTGAVSSAGLLKQK